jgi:hypothetical protein
MAVYDVDDFSDVVPPVPKVLRRVNAALAQEIRDEEFADDIDMPDYRGWREDDLHAFFASGGISRPESYKIPIEDMAFTRLCEENGLGKCAEQLFGTSIEALSLSCHSDRSSCVRWLTHRGVDSDMRRKLMRVLDAFIRRSQGNKWQKPCVIKATHGLCNKLRVVLAHHALMQEQKRPLLVIWRASDNCPGRFADFFEPLSDVSFIDDDVPLPIEYESCDCHPSIKYTSREALVYRALRPNGEVESAVAANLKVIGGPFVAVHIRRTDHVPRDQTRMDDFIRFLTAHADVPIFVATDNVKTQQELLGRFGSRVCGMKLIQPSRTLRQTTLFDAVVELLTCVHAKTFKGSHASSFSDTIKHLRESQQTCDEADEHAVAVPKDNDQLNGRGVAFPKDDGAGFQFPIDLLSRIHIEMAQAAAADAGRY